MYKYFAYIILLFFLSAGCQKPADVVLTNYQSTQITPAGAVQLINSKGEPVLLVDGQEINSNDIINEPAKLLDLYLIPGKYLEPIAQGMEFDEFRERIRKSLTIILEDKIEYILMYNSAKKQFKDRLDETLDNAVENEVRRFYLQFGGAKANLWGTVSHISRPSDVTGVYAAAGAGAAGIKGKGIIVLTNEKGAVLQLQGNQTGLMVNADFSGMAISLK